MTSLSYSSNACRVCLQTKRIKKSVLNSYFESLCYPEIFLKCTGIDVVKRTDHPQWICNKCDKQLIDLYSFRQKCIEADETLNGNDKKSESDDETPLNELDKSYIQSESEESESDDGKQVYQKITKQPPEIDVHLLNPQVKCDFCDQKFTNETTLKVHQNIMHLNDCKTFKCNICNSTFYTENLRDKHIRTHSGAQNVKCRYCEKVFNNSGTRENHERRHHTGVKPYKCLVCEDKTFFSKSEYNRHTKRLHSKERPFICKVCNKTFTINSDLVVHMKMHDNIREFQCDICGHVSLTASNLLYHKKMVHESTEQHPCNLCSETFNKKPALWKHQKTMHCGDHICNICGVCLMTARYLKTHRLLHDESNKKFKCTVCENKGFVKNAGLRRHMRDSHPTIEPPPPLLRHPNAKGKRRVVKNPGSRSKN